MPDDDSASARQKLIVAIVQHLQSTDTSLTHAELLAGYSAAVGFDVASRANAEGLIQDVYDYLEQAITETLEKPDIQAKGITREMLEARLPSRPERQETPQETPDATSESRDVSDVEVALETTFGPDGVSLETWNTSDDADRRRSLQRAEQGIVLQRQAGNLTPEAESQKEQPLRCCGKTFKQRLPPSRHPPSRHPPNPKHP